MPNTKNLTLGTVAILSAIALNVSTAMAGMSNYAGNRSGSNATDGLRCGNLTDIAQRLIGFRVVQDASGIVQIGGVCQRGSMLSRRDPRSGRVTRVPTWFSGRTGRSGTGSSPRALPAGTGRQTISIVCSRDKFVSSVSVYTRTPQAVNIQRISFQCASFTGENWDFDARAGIEIKQTGPAGGVSQGMAMCSNRPLARGLSVKRRNSIPTQIALDCPTAAPTAGATSAGQPPVQTPLPWSPVWYDDTRKFVNPTGGLTVKLARAVPNATRYEAWLRTTSDSPAVQQTLRSQNAGRDDGGKWAVPFGRFQAGFNNRQVRYQVRGCNNSNECTRWSAINDFMASAGGASSTPAPTATLSFGRDIYPLITATTGRSDLGQGTPCIGCHSRNLTYPQKLQTNAGQCGVNAAPSIPFTSMMNATTMLNLLKCLRASSTSGVYSSALGKVYVVPGNYQNSGLYHKAMSSSAFSPQIRNLIRDWIAQGAAN